TGLYNLLTNTLTVDVYIKGTSGTPYWVSVLGAGTASAARVHGMPGSLQPVNGTSTGGFMDTMATVNATASVSIPVAETLWTAGNTSNQITVGTGTYSFAGTYPLSASAFAIQTFCVLGCMTEGARFDADGGGHVEIDVYPYVNPLSVGAPAIGRGSLSLQAAPNPLRGSARISFSAPAGERTEIEAFDVRGRRVARLCDLVATGETQEFTWHARGLAQGVYFLRMRHGGETTTEKVALVP
ncbi:MAG: T9SS type A sorting domain-containing protein, partial [Candidatus Eiseniibacteriota bacterium]